MVLNKINKLWRYLFVLMGLASCVPVKYSPYKVARIEGRGYQVVYDGRPVEFKNIVLSRDNIRKVNKNFISKRIRIIPVSRNVKFKTGEEWVNEIRLATGQEFGMIVVNGLPYFKVEDLKPVQIEQTMALQYNVLDTGMLNQIGCLRPDKPVLIVTFQ